MGKLFTALRHSSLSLSQHQMQTVSPLYVAVKNTTSLQAYNLITKHYNLNKLLPLER
jgi:hypothetical protein